MPPPPFFALSLSLSFSPSLSPFLSFSLPPHPPLYLSLYTINHSLYLSHNRYHSFAEMKNFNNIYKSFAESGSCVVIGFSRTQVSFTSGSRQNTTESVTRFGLLENKQDCYRTWVSFYIQPASRFGLMQFCCSDHLHLDLDIIHTLAKILDVSGFG